MGYTPHVLVVGGGPVGAGLARDFAIRGLDVTLVDRGPLADPRLGRMEGVLASGAQFAREDPELARRCLHENRTLFEIASHCITDTGGLVVGDDLEAVTTACEECGIAARHLSGSEAREREPGLSSAVDGALAVPDAAVDPYLLTVATARDAREYGAKIRPQTAVTDIRVADGAVEEVTLRQDPLPSGVDAPDDEAHADGGVPGKSVPGTLGPGAFEDDDPEDRPEPLVTDREVDYVVNAAGADAPEITALADCSFPVTRQRSTVLVTAERLVETAVTRAGGPIPDSAAPVGQHTLLARADPDGDTAGPGDTDAAVAPTPSAVDGAATALSELVEDAETARHIRAFESQRYVVGPGRGRDFAAIDHGDYDDCWGLLTVLGGTVTTHRWLAERICDRVCEEFGIRRECQTADLLLPGSEDRPELAQAVGTFGLAEPVYEHSRRRLGSQTAAVLHTDGPNPVLCETQSVTRAEVQAALADDTAGEASLGGVRVRTSAATGACQGGRCAHRLAATLHPEYDHELVAGACLDLLDERWRGQRPLTGEQVAEMARAYRLHAGRMNRHDQLELRHADIARLDGDQDHETARPTCCPRAGPGWES